MSELINENIGFRFVSIEIRSKSLKELGEAKENVKITFNVRSNSKVMAEQGIVIMNTTVLIFDANSTDIFAEFNVDCLFQVIEFEKHIKLNDRKLYVIPPQLEGIIKPVSISTVRGIIYSELRGTYLNNVIMPVIFMDSMQREEAPAE